VTSPWLRRAIGPIAVASLLSMALTAGTTAGVLARSTGDLARSTGDSARPASTRPIGHAKPGSGPSNLIDHGGPVLLHSKTVAIFWGPTSAFDPQLQPAMVSLLGGMDGSAYLQVAQQYMRTASQISSSEGIALHDTSTPPKTALSTSNLGAEVAKLVATPDPDTIYFVFTSNMPHISYCAYHSDATANGVLVEVAYVPLQPAGCSPLGSVNLHANSYDESVQASADSAAHEFMEAVTDPHLNAWYDKNGSEVADKCEYNYQGVVHLANHSTWQIQSEWSNAISACDPALGS